MSQWPPMSWKKLLKTQGSRADDPRRNRQYSQKMQSLQTSLRRPLWVFFVIPKKLFWILFQMLVSFLDASSHLYKRACTSVRPSVGRSVRRSVGHAFVKNKENHYIQANNCRSRYTRQISCNHIIISSSWGRIVGLMGLVFLRTILF